MSRREDVENIIKSIKTTHNRLNGIIHGAGLIKDAFITRKQEEDIEKVLKPKVSGIINIDEVTRDEDLDFIVLFSSIAGVIGNLGQADYSGANAFLDAYAEYRNNQVKQGKRSGKTVSINWSLWKDGGMNIDEQSERLIKATLGMSLLKTETGIEAFYKAINSKHDQLMVVEGVVSKITEKLFLTTKQTVNNQKQINKADNMGEVAQSELFEKVK